MVATITVAIAAIVAAAADAPVVPFPAVVVAEVQTEFNY
ncbi:hypothetical protein FHW89_005903 [Mucilaginibacter sp. SG564]|nr:hypothetical protein [Mucilaginibacter sp. SG564]